ncbi:lipopolysaccharide biosynthesis protein [Flavisphingopyxis soli]|uniref:lipopolysaccharide biosynthesis protein n=1 Tax=Flavisphingopyxis soli TaxID=2601267 RepID=UPI00191C388A|nr:lipopolysaccharide biosynthesis protein [Sphingorhabdus soli]
MPALTAEEANGADVAALAKGGRTNFFGFVLRLAARLPFLYIAGRWYGAAALGRFAYAILIVEFAAQLATLGLKRGLAEQLSSTDRHHTHVVWDGLLVSLIVSSIAAVILIAFPEAMFPNSDINGLDRLLPLVIFAVAGTDIALAALAYRYDVAATVRARSIVEPWTISFAAIGFAFYSTRDGLIMAYVVSMVAAMIAAMIPLIRSYGLPHGWRPRTDQLRKLARRNAPLAAADAIEWGSRRIDLAILGLFASPAIVGIYYVAQQVASLPQKLKTSFEPILGPVITRNLEAGNMKAIAVQISQVSFWVIAAQAGIALALGIPGEAVMGLVGATFVGGTGALAFLLAAEVVASTAAVAEGALVYVARHRNLMISVAMICLQAVLSVGFVLVVRTLHLPPTYEAGAVACALMVSLGLSSILKARLLAKILEAPVSGWRWALAWATAGAMLLGYGAIQLPEWAELAFGVPIILAIYGYIVWTKGFGAEDRALFRSKGAADEGMTFERLEKSE